MKISVVAGIGEPVARVWLGAQKVACMLGDGHLVRPAPIQDRRFRVAAPLSGSPLPVYRWIIDHDDLFPHWNAVDFILMDELVETDDTTTYISHSYIGPSDPASYEGFARREFIDRLSSGRPNLIKPELSTLATCDIEIDLLILAIGPSGNYANVMPGTSLDTGWHVTRLTDEFRTAHTTSPTAAYNDTVFRDFGMSLGPQQVLKAKQVVVIATGSHKQHSVAQLLSLDAFDPEFPISIVHHPDLTSRVQLFATPDAMAS